MFEYGFALSVVALTCALVGVLGGLLELTPTDRVMIHLLGVVVVAYWARLGPSLLAALASVAAFDFFFVEPIHTFSVDEAHYRVTFVVMAGVGMSFSWLSARLREQVQLAQTREQQAAALARAQREAELEAERERLRASLLASVSHDLRTPLGAILGAVTTLEEGGERIDPETQSQLLAAIHDQAELLARQLRNLLEMTRFEGGGLELQRELGTVEEPIGVVLGALQHRLGDREVDVQNPVEPLYARFDPVAVELVLSNLLENALRHGEGTIEIRVEAGGDREVEIRVLDRGPGLPPGGPERLFEKFVRGSKASTGGGVGLGLAIVALLVRESGGRVWARTRSDGPGAEFGFSLPRSFAPEIPEAEA